MTGNPTALNLERPYTAGDALQADEARAACQMIARARHEAREALAKATEKLATKEKLYRKARAVAYVEHSSAKSAGQRDSLVDEATADDRYERDVAAGMVRACEERLKEIDGERASLHRLIDWSARLDPYAAEGQREQSPVRAAA